MDAVSDLLRVVKAEASVFSTARAGGRWGVSTHGAAGAIFHLVRAGSGVIQVEGHEATFGPGDLLLMPHGSPHVLSDSPATTPTWIGALPGDTGPDGLPCVRAGQGDEVSLVCGAIHLDPDSRELLLPHLPPLVHVRGEGSAAAAWVDATLRWVVDGAERDGAELLLARVSDVLLVQILRAWLAGGHARGWLAALTHPVLSRSLHLLHQEPARDWSADTLARRVGVSRSALYATFTAGVGEPPAAYLTRWRMWLARRALRAPHSSVAEVGRSVGYASEAAFTRAFSRVVGAPPSVWRRAQGAAAR